MTKHTTRMDRAHAALPPMDNAGRRAVSRLAHRMFMVECAAGATLDAEDLSQFGRAAALYLAVPRIAAMSCAKRGRAALAMWKRGEVAW